MRETEASVDPHQNELFDTHSEVLGYERSPLDVLRLLGFAAGTLMLALLTKYLREGIDGLEENITSVLEVPWSWAQLTVDVLLIVVVVVAGLAALVVPLITKRFRLFGYVLIANVATTMLLGALVGWVGLSGTSGVTDASAEAAARGVAADVVGAAHLVAAFVTISPFVGRKWRRAGGWTVLTMVADAFARRLGHLDPCGAGSAGGRDHRLGRAARLRAADDPAPAGVDHRRPPLQRYSRLRDAPGERGRPRLGPVLRDPR